jgi:hypothetical protein
VYIIFPLLLYLLLLLFCRSVILLMSCVTTSYPQGSTFVGTGSGAPEVPELPSARWYSRATRPHGDINSGDWYSRLGVGRRANIPSSLKKYIVQKPKEVCRTDLRKRLWKRNKAYDLNLATWSVRSLFTPVTLKNLTNL